VCGSGKQEPPRVFFFFFLSPAYSPCNPGGHGDVYIFTGYLHLRPFRDSHRTMSPRPGDLASRPQHRVTFSQVLNPNFCQVLCSLGNKVGFVIRRTRHPGHLVSKRLAVVITASHMGSGGDERCHVGRLCLPGTRELRLEYFQHTMSVNQRWVNESW
jgi:hypothetical protein